jgi:hypothetical protein
MMMVERDLIHQVLSQTKKIIDHPTKSDNTFLGLVNFKIMIQEE